MLSTIAADSTVTVSPSHVVGRESDVLREIAEPEVNLALWQRPAIDEVVQELLPLQAPHLPDVRRRTSLASIDKDVRSLLMKQGLNPQEFRSLRLDLQQLAALLASASRCSNFIFRLVTIAGDECRRFHLDRTPLRLICTYQGPGTEWLADWQVDRAALARCASNDAITRAGEPSQFELFWVGVFKGDPDNRGRGLVHRSPAVKSSGQIRVVFCLDCAG